MHTMTEYLRLDEAVKHVPGGGKPPHPSALWRWCRRGLKAGNGEVIRLKHARRGRALLVRPADIERFFEELGAADVKGTEDANTNKKSPV